LEGSRFSLKWQGEENDQGSTKTVEMKLQKISLQNKKGGKKKKKEEMSRGRSEERSASK